MKFELYRETTIDDELNEGDTTGDWRWRMRARNGRIVAEGGEGYEHAHDLVRTVRGYVAITMYAQGALAKACYRAGLTSTGRIARRPMKA